jgi:hypothetical protein
MVDVPEGFPVSTSRWNIDLRGAPTDVLFCAYENLNMLTITHTQTMGTVLLAKYVLIATAMLSSGLSQCV